jgi:hypothetical protein
MTKITNETTRTVKTLGEAKELIDEAFNRLGLKSINLFVWSDATSGIQVKISQEFEDPNEQTTTHTGTTAS